MLSTRRMIGTALLLPVIALAAACTSQTHPAAATPVPHSPAGSSPAASSPAASKPPVPAKLPVLAAPGATLLSQSGSGGPVTFTSTPATAGAVTLQFSCVGGMPGAGLAIKSGSPGNTLLFSSQNQPCLGEIHKVTFNPGAQPAGMQVAISGLPSGYQYVVMLSE